MATLKYRDPQTGQYKSDIHVVGAVSSVNGKNGVVNLNSEDVGAMEYYILTFDGTHFFHDGVQLTFTQIKNACLDDHHFVYAQYDGDLYIPQHIQGALIFFDATYIRNGKAEIHRISITPAGTGTEVIYVADSEDLEGKQDVISDLDEIRDGAAKGDTSVQDVQINGASIVSDGVANVPIGSNSRLGIVRGDTPYGTYINPTSGLITTQGANESDIAARINEYKGITPKRLNPAVKATLTDSNKMELTDSEKETACDTLGATSSKELLDAGIKSISWSVSRSEISVTTVEDPYKAQRPSGTNTRYWAKFDSCPYFYHDKLYRVTLDGVEQVPCACRYGYLQDEKKGSTHGSDTSVGGAWQAIGNMYLYDSRYPDTGEDYCVLYLEHGGMHDGGAYYYGYEVGKGILMTRSAKTVTLKIETATLTRTKLPNALLDNFGRGDPMYVDFPNSTYYRVSLGQGNLVTGRGSTGIGFGNYVAEQGSTAIGVDNIVTGWNATAIGNKNTSSGQCSYAEGMYTKATGAGSHAEGGYSGYNTEGKVTEASGIFSHAEGSYARASGIASHAENNGTIASGEYSHAEGDYSMATGTAAHAEGGYYGYLSENKFTEASGYASHAEGIYTQSSALGSHSEGSSTIASGGYSHAEGYSTTASGYQCHAEGYFTVAAVNSSHSEGQNTYAAERGAHAEGLGTRAVKMAQNVIGVNNIEDTETGMTAAISTIDSNGTPTSSVTNRTLGKYAHIVGNGISNAERSNAHTLDWDGNAWYAGNGEFAGGSIKVGNTTITEAQLNALLALLG